jgi:hypothetical protein
MVDPSVRIHVTDVHFAVEMLNVVLEIIMLIAVANQVLLVMPKSVVERSNVNQTKTVQMTNYVIKICARLPA